MTRLRQDRLLDPNPGLSGSLIFSMRLNHILVTWSRSTVKSHRLTMAWDHGKLIVTKRLQRKGNGGTYELPVPRQETDQPFLQKT